MSRIHYALAVVLSLALACSAAEEKRALKSRDFRGFLYRGSGGHVWYGYTLSPFGMYATVAGSKTQYRLSPSLAKRLKPFVNEIGDLQGDLRNLRHLEYLEGRRALSATPKIYVGFHGRYRQARVTVKEGTMDDWFGEAQVYEIKQYTYEIVSADLAWIEVYPGAWLTAWRRLDEALREIVASSLTAPAPAKRERIIKAMDKGATALSAMATRHDDEKMAAVIRNVEPRARLVNFGKHGRQSVHQDWRRLLEQFGERLRIPLRPSPPPLPEKFEARDVLLKSSSPQAFIAEVRKSRPDAMEELAAFSNRLGNRVLRVWEIEYLTDAEYRTLVEEIRENEAMMKIARERSATKPAAKPRQLPKRVTIEEQGITIGLLGNDLMSEKLILGGVLVEKVRPGSKSGLRAGDVILTYKSPYELSHGRGSTTQTLFQFAQMAREWSGVKFNVLRGDEVVEVVITNRK